MIDHDGNIDRANQKIHRGLAAQDGLRPLADIEAAPVGRLRWV
jgi:hypothetical protein